MYQFRALVAIFLFVVGSVAAVMLSFTVPEEFLPDPVDFTRVEGASALFLAAGSAMTAVVFWGLSDIADACVYIAHVRALEVAAFGAAPPAVCGFLSFQYYSNRAAQRQVLFTVLPQVGALVIPLLFSYLAFAWKASQFAGSEVAEEEKV